MKQTILILQREFNTRVRKKSFIITTLLTPILFAGLMVLPTYLMQMDDTQERKIAVVDNTLLYSDVITSSDYLNFSYVKDTPAEQLKTTLEQAGYYALLTIDSLSNRYQPKLTIYSTKQPSMDVISYIENSMEKEIETRKLQAYNIENLDKIMDDVKTKVTCSSMKISEDGQEKQSSALVSMGFAYVMGFIIYMMVLLTGNQVMQGVIEEKNDRVIELMVSSIKPFNLMMGKILGIASVSLVQILTWVVLTIGLASIGMNMVLGDTHAATATEQLAATQGVDTTTVSNALNAGGSNEFISALKNQNYGLIIGGFIFFFLFGYLLYAAMYAAVGSAVESVNDTQQLVMPMTVPMIVALFVMLYTMKAPDGALAFWCSIIPFTSPIVMLARIPFGVPAWEIALSAALLLVTFIATTHIAAKIYRVGILMYGKKPTLKEMWKWMKYKN